MRDGWATSHRTPSRGATRHLRWHTLLAGGARRIPHLKILYNATRSGSVPRSTSLPRLDDELSSP